ncbi:B3 domain-containing protein REM9, partial [Bienertia sinuspersici]
SIPVAFAKYLREFKREIKVELRDKSGRRWYVKLVNSSVSDDKRPRFKDGWICFCKEHDLHVGDFLVFEYHGNFVFDVLIFAPNACERQLPYFESTSMVKFKNPHNHIAKKFKGEEIKVGEGTISKNGSSSFMSISYPWCRIVLQPYCLTSSIIHLPREFAEKNGLSKRWCDIEVIDEKGQSWSMLLRHYRTRNNGLSYIGGLTNFLNTYHIKIGDALIFQLIESGFKPIMKCY